MISGTVGGNCGIRIRLTVPVDRGISRKNISAVGCLLDAESAIIRISPVNLLPYKIAPGIQFHHQDILVRRAGTPAAAGQCYPGEDVSAVSCLPDAECYIVRAASQHVLPLDCRGIGCRCRTGQQGYQKESGNEISPWYGFHSKSLC